MIIVFTELWRQAVEEIGVFQYGDRLPGIAHETKFQRRDETDADALCFEDELRVRAKPRDQHIAAERHGIGVGASAVHGDLAHCRFSRDTVHCASKAY